MITAFIITTLVVFMIYLIANMLVIGFNAQNGNIPYMLIVNMIVNLVMITWSIIALVSY